VRRVGADFVHAVTVRVARRGDAAARCRGASREWPARACEFVSARRVDSLRHRPLALGLRRSRAAANQRRQRHEGPQNVGLGSPDCHGRPFLAHGDGTGSATASPNRETGETSTTNVPYDIGRASTPAHAEWLRDT
jgi:hypothetical protein